MTSSICGIDFRNFAKVSLFKTHFSPRRQRFNSNLRQSIAKDNRLSFQNIYLKSWLSFFFTEIIALEVCTFFKVHFENVKMGGTKISGPEAPVGAWSSIIIAKGWNCGVGYVESWISESCTWRKNSKLVENRKKRKNREILQFLLTLSTSNSESMAYIQFSLHTHVDVVAVNKSPKGQSDWVNSTAIMGAQSWHFEKFSK